MDEATRADMAAWTGCIAGALTETEFRSALEAAGLGDNRINQTRSADEHPDPAPIRAGHEDIEIKETHSVHEHAASALIRARKPGGAGCCPETTLSSCCEPAAKEPCCGQRTAAGDPVSCGCS